MYELEDINYDDISIGLCSEKFIPNTKWFSDVEMKGASALANAEAWSHGNQFDFSIS